MVTTHLCAAADAGKLPEFVVKYDLNISASREMGCRFASAVSRTALT